MGSKTNLLNMSRFLTSLERQAGVSEHGNSRGPERDRVGVPLSIDESYDCTQSDSELDSRRASTALDEAFTNPLVSGNSVYIADRTGQPCESRCEHTPSYQGLTPSLLQPTSGHLRIGLLAGGY